MTTKMAVEKSVQPEVVIPAEAKVPEEFKQQAMELTAALTEHLQKQKADFKKRMAALKTAGAVIEAGEPALVGGYQYWNILSYGPYQWPLADPAYRPTKVIAAGEWTLMAALIWVNPDNGPGGSLPGTIVLGDREYTLRFESIDLTNVADGPDFSYTNRFASVADEFTWVYWWSQPGDPGPAPRLYETSLTVDVNLGGQPFAGFGLWHFDPDTELPFLGMPTASSHWQFERPARFMVYRK